MAKHAQNLKVSVFMLLNCMTEFWLLLREFRDTPGNAKMFFCALDYSKIPSLSFIPKKNPGNFQGCFIKYYKTLYPYYVNMEL